MLLPGDSGDKFGCPPPCHGPGGRSSHPNAVGMRPLLGASWGHRGEDTGWGQGLILLESPRVTRAGMAAGPGWVKPSEGTPDHNPCCQGVTISSRSPPGPLQPTKCHLARSQQPLAMRGAAPPSSQPPSGCQHPLPKPPHSPPGPHAVSPCPARSLQRQPCLGPSLPAAPSTSLRSQINI